MSLPFRFASCWDPVEAEDRLHATYVGASGLGIKLLGLFFGCPRPSAHMILKRPRTAAELGIRLCIQLLDLFLHWPQSYRNRSARPEVSGSFSDMAEGHQV